MAGEEKKKKPHKRFMGSVLKTLTDITGIPLEQQKSSAETKELSQGEETRQILTKVYRLGKSACLKSNHGVNCMNNPKCLRGFGEYKEGIWAKGGYDDDPSLLLRADNAPFIGLRNLGATCYINSLLQTLFMNRRFRDIIFKYEGEDRLCRSLQLLFTKLQESNKNYSSPEEITTILQISTSVQQDVQEFNNLFMSLLTEKLKKSSIVEVQHFITEEYQGVQRYETKCKRCGKVSRRETPFQELELSIRMNSSLSGCIKTLLKEEILSGDNKYDCEKCGLAEAVRKLELVEIPPVLNIQLLRFVYDQSTGTKQKLSSPITFPFTLDLSSFCRHVDKAECSYQLTAILLHLGNSAAHGHYISHILDEESKEWWKFDDKRVTELELKDVGESAQLYETEAKLGTREKAKSFITNLGKKKITSQNAYMLVYTKIKDRPTPNPKAPLEALQPVKKANEMLCNRINEWSNHKMVVSEAVNTHKLDYQKFMKLAPTCAGEPYRWIDAAWLKKWTIGESNGPIDNNQLLCIHGKLDPKKEARTKLLHVRAWDFLLSIHGGGPELSGSSLCKECAFLVHDTALIEACKNNEIRRIINLSERARVTEGGFWVSNLWLKQWKDAVKNGEEMMLDPDICGLIVCEHGNMTAKAVRKLVCNEVWTYLRASYSEGLEFPRDTEPCPICEESNKKRLQVLREQKQIKTQQKYALPSFSRPISVNGISPGTYYVVSTEFIRRWFSFVGVTQGDNLTQFDRKTMLCEHDMLFYDPLEINNYRINVRLPTRLVTEGEWKKLLEFYGEADPIQVVVMKGGEPQISPPVCRDCASIKETENTLNLMEYAQAKVWIEVPSSSPLGASLLTSFTPGKQEYRFALTVSREDTVHVLKLKILQRINVQPIQQQLLYRGEELENAMTMNDHLIPPGARIVLHKIKSKHAKTYDDGDTNTVHVEDIPMVILHPSSNVPPSPALEHGFSGSLLTGGGDDMDMGFEDIEEEWTCPACTMKNFGDVCEVCELPNPAVFGGGDAPQPSFHEEAELWICKNCTVPNEMMNNHCIACSRTRQK